MKPKQSNVRGIGGPDAPLLVVAGPIGCGKSTVCGWLAERGAHVLDADRIGHEMLLDPGVRALLVEAFGDVLGEDGQIDRHVLGRLVFSDDALLARLNGIVHPPLVAELRRRLELLRGSRGVELIVVDAALWTQFPDPPDVDLLLHVTAPASVRRERIMARDGLSMEAADARLARQRDLEASLVAADAVLENASSPADVRTRLFELLDARLGLALVSTDPGAWPQNAPE